jgi:hypothetical protein
VHLDASVCGRSVGSSAGIDQRRDDLVDVSGERAAAWQEVRRGVRYLRMTEIGSVGEQSTVSGTGGRESKPQVELGQQR